MVTLDSEICQVRHVVQSFICVGEGKRGASEGLKVDRGACIVCSYYLGEDGYLSYLP